MARVSVGNGIMKQHKFCPDKQQYNNVRPFPVYVVATAEVQNYITNVSNMAE